MSGGPHPTAPAARGARGDAGLAAGDSLAHYRILAKIGAGGMGEVYAAEDQKLKRKVALKILPSRVAGNPADRQRFEREAKAAAALSHPNVVSLYSVEESEGRLFITMELLQGQTLAEILEGSALPLDQLLRWAIPLVDAVSAAHQVGIVHRDLKPQNIMIGADERLRVLDFGLARIDGDGSLDADPAGVTATMTVAGHIVGTAAYMSPEQVEGKRADGRSDIFSLGIVLFEMATGQRPFEGESGVAILAAILRDTPPLLSTLKPELPLRLGQIVRRCLEKKPDARFRSATDLRHALEDLQEELRGGGPSARVTGRQLPPAAPTTPAEGPVGARDRRAWRLLLVPVVLAVIAAAAFAGHHLGAEGALRTRAPIVGILTQLTSDQGPELSPSLAPDGTWFVYASRTAGNWDIHRLRVGGEIPMVLTADCKEDDTEPAISPDGERIAFRSERLGGGVFVMGATGESVRRVTDFGYRPSWTPDGLELLVTTEPVKDPQFRAGQDSEVWAVQVDGGGRRLVVKGDALHAVASPHGTRIAYWGSHSGGIRDLWTAPLAGGGEPVQLTDDPAIDWAPRWSADGSMIYFSSNRGGNMNLWRVPVDEGSGRPQGPPEAVTNGALGSAYDASFSRDGTRMIYAVGGLRARIERVRFDSQTEAVVGAPVLVGAGLSAREVGGRVIFVVASPNEDIAVIRPDGTGRHKLTDDPYRDRMPRISPDGQQVAFTSDRGGGFDIWSLRVDGSGLTRLTAGGRLTIPVWSPDGRKMAAYRLGEGTLLFDPGRPWKEQVPQKLPPLPHPTETFCAYDWSPDGRALVGSAGPGDPGREVWVYSVERGDYESFATASTVETPVWLGDGRRILYVAGDDRVSLLDTASGKSHVLISVAPDTLFGASISDDGQWLYVERHANDGDIWMATLK